MPGRRGARSHPLSLVPSPWPEYVHPWGSIAPRITALETKLEGTAIRGGAVKTGYHLELQP